MSSWTLTHKDANGSTTAEYVIEGALTVKDRLTQSTTQVSFPNGKYDTTLLNSLLGQKNVMQLTFLLLQRSDDYTAATGSPGDGSPFAQKTFLKDSVFVANGYHVFKDQNDSFITGRIQDMDIDVTSDDPFIGRVSMTFLVGAQPV